MNKKNSDHQGDMGAEAFSVVYRDFYKKVLTYLAARTDSYEDARELTGDIFVSIFQNMDRFDPNIAGWDSWVFAIAKNRLKNYYKSKKPEVLMDDLSDGTDDFEKSAEDIFMGGYTRLALHEAIDRLSDREQKILIGKFFHGKKYGVIAGELGLTPVNVRVIARRALDKLGKALREHNS